MKQRPALQALAAVALAASASLSHAALTAYSTQASFLAAVASPGTDGFDGLSTLGSTASPLHRNAGGYGYTVSSLEFFGAGTAADPALSTTDATDSITFSGFTGGVSAVGGLFFGTDFDGVLSSGTLTLVATDASGATLSRSVTGIDSRSFVGFSSDVALTSLVFSTVQPGDARLWPTVDNLTLAVSAVPEPQGWLLLALGLPVLVATRRFPRKP